MQIKSGNCALWKTEAGQILPSSIYTHFLEKAGTQYFLGMGLPLRASYISGLSRVHGGHESE